MKHKKFFIVFSVMILLVLLLVPILADDVREYRSEDPYNLPDRFSLDREDAIDVPEPSRAAYNNYFYIVNNAVQLKLGFESINLSNVQFMINSGGSTFFSPISNSDAKNRIIGNYSLDGYYPLNWVYLTYNYDASRTYPSTWNNAEVADDLLTHRLYTLNYNSSVILPVAVYYTLNGVDFARCDVNTNFIELFRTSSCTFVYVWNTGYNISGMFSFFVSISSWIHDNTLIPLDIAERLVTLFFLTVFYVVIIRFPIFCLNRGKESKIRGKWVDVFYFCFCVSYMCAPLWIGVFNL